jgi:hypothetical protein
MPHPYRTERTTFFIRARRNLRTAAAAACLALPAALPAAQPGVPPSGVVYVESNIASPGGNSIFAFQRDGAGNLSPLPGSPFATGGTGILDPSLKLGPFDSDQNVIANPEHTLLFAVNSGSDTIAVFHILPDGGLAPVNGSPFPSGGINPVSVGYRNGILTVVNKNEDPNQNVPGAQPNFTNFRVNPEGRLIPIPQSTVPVAPGSSPTQALTVPSLPLVFGTEFFGGLVESFVVESNGRLLRNPPQPVPASEFGNAPRLPLGLATHPLLPVLYVGFVPVSRIGVYRFDAAGIPAFVRSVSDSGAAVCWLAVNKSGTRMYASNTGDNSISVFDLQDPYNPVEIQHLLLRGPGSSFQLALDNADRFLHVVSQRADAATPLGQGNAVHVLRIAADGTLTEAASSPVNLVLPEGTRPQGVVAF